jgi:anti-repressor protein
VTAGPTRGIPDPGRASSAVEMVVAGADSSVIQLFKFEHQPIRVVLVDGDPWFVLSDLCRALGISNVGNVAARLHEDDIRQTDVTDTLSRCQLTKIVNESGMYEVVIRSDKKEAARFRRWVTHKVLPDIRRTGSYDHLPAQSRQLPSKKELAQWVVEAEERAEQAEAKVAKLAPPAAAWTELAEAAGDYSVADAAKVLSRDANITTGERRLFASMQAFGWIFRRDGRWRAYQRFIERGWLTEKVGKPYVRNGEMCVGDPTVRITPKGLAALHNCLGGSGQLALMAVSE